MYQIIDTMRTAKTQKSKLSVDYTYRIYRVLVFLIFLLILVRLGSESTEIDHFRFVISALIVYIVMERYYPSVVVTN